MDKFGIKSQIGSRYSQESISMAYWLPLIWSNQQDKITYLYAPIYIENINIDDTWQVQIVLLQLWVHTARYSF
jgi:hypothetical protein